MTGTKMNVEHRTLVIKAGMTPQDVMKSDKATAEQKKMAFVFDSDGVAGYSQREADVFNATLIADHGKQGISLWTRYEDDSRKETKFVGDVASFKYAPKGDVKPYTVKKGTQTKAVRATQTTPKEKPLPPLTQVVAGDTLTYYSKQDSIAFNKKEDAAYAKYEAADKAAYAKFEAADKAGYAKFEATDNAGYAKYEAADDGSLKSKAYDEWRNSSAKAYDEWQATIKQAQQEHCSQVKEYKHK